MSNSPMRPVMIKEKYEKYILSPNFTVLGVNKLKIRKFSHKALLILTPCIVIVSL